MTIEKIAAIVSQVRRSLAPMKLVPKHILMVGGCFLYSLCLEAKRGDKKEAAAMMKRVCEDTINLAEKENARLIELH